MEANEPSYSVYAPSNFPSLAPVSASSRSGSRPPLRGAAPQRGSGLFFLFVIAAMVAGAGIAGITYLSPRLEAKHSGTSTTNAVLAKGDDSNTGPTFKVDLDSKSDTTDTTTTTPATPATTTPATTPTTAPAAKKGDARPAPGATVASANPDKNKPKRRVVKRAPSSQGASSSSANALPDSRMPTAKLPDNPYPDKD